MISMAGLELPIRALRSQFASAVDLIIQASRLQGGPRKVTSISEVVGMEGDTIIMQEIFAFRQIGRRSPTAGRSASSSPPASAPRSWTGWNMPATSSPADLFRQRVLLKD